MTAIEIPTIPGLDELCIQVFTGQGELCVEFPGGGRLCASFGVDIGDPSQIVAGLLAQINAALMPLQPFFNVLDVVKCIADCIQAIPDCLGPLPSPVPILKCIPKLVEALQRVIQMLPIFTIPKLIKGILEVIITSMIGLRQKLIAMLRHLDRILAAATKAATLGGGIGLELQGMIDCAQANLDAQLANENAALLPLNRLIGLVNVLLALAQLPCIPTLGGLAALGEEALAPLDAAIQVLQTIAAAIPVSLTLPAIPGPDDPC